MEACAVRFYLTCFYCVGYGFYAFQLFHASLTPTQENGVVACAEPVRFSCLLNHVSFLGWKRNWDYADEIY